MATDYFINLKDANLMQMVYEQDVDLGYEYGHLSEPAKAIKEIDNIANTKSSLYAGGHDFLIDGETGEQLPKVPNSLNINSLNYNQFQNNQQLNFDFEDCLDLVNNSTNDFQCQKSQNLNQSPEWNQPTQFSELTTMNPSGVQRTSSNSFRVEDNPLTNSNTRYSNMQYGARQIFENHYQYTDSNTVNPCNGSNIGNIATPSFNNSLFEPNMRSLPPRYSSASQSTSSIFSSVMSSDEGMSVDMNGPSPVKQESLFPFEICNQNYSSSSQQTSPIFREEKNPISSFSESGQRIFDLGPNNSDYISDFASNKPSVPLFPKNTNSSFSNLAITPVPPPPLQSPSSYQTIPYDSSEHLFSKSLRTPLSEYYESDSGISVDNSPKGFNFYNPHRHDGLISSNQDLSSSNQIFDFHLQEIKPVGFNNITTMNTAKRHTKKKTERIPLSRESRDEKKARELNIPFTLDEIILTPVEDYNEMLARTHLTANQHALIKDIRRRGKNKVAAQNCRKRKIETITLMEEDVDILRHRKQQLTDEKKDLERQHHNMKLRYQALYKQVFNSLRDDSGHPYDPSQYRLDQVDGTISVVRHSCSGAEQFKNASNQLKTMVDFSKIKFET